MGRCTKDNIDMHFRTAWLENWRARSVYKLLWIIENENILENVSCAIDLCGAPGSWTQALVKHGIKTVLVDIQNVEPIPGSIIIRGDITDPNVLTETRSALGSLADLLLSDGSAEVTGFSTLDFYMQEDLINVIINSMHILLKPGGVFVSKAFIGTGLSILISKLEKIFDEIKLVKPDASRDSSNEIFILGKNYKGSQ